MARKRDKQPPKTKKYFRPTEVNFLCGNSNKAKKMLKWTPKTDINTLIKKMCDYELKSILLNKLYHLVL